MACYYCSKAQVVSDDIGVCHECSKQVCDKTTCVRPNFHSQSCRCGCDEIVCFLHMHTHSLKFHPNSAASCFADTEIALAVSAASGIERLLGPVDDESASDAVCGIQDYLIFRHAGRFREVDDFNYLVQSQHSMLLQPSVLAALLPDIAESMTTAIQLVEPATLNTLPWATHVFDKIRSVAALAMREYKSETLKQRQLMAQMMLLSPRLAALLEAGNAWGSNERLSVGGWSADATLALKPPLRWSEEAVVGLHQTMAKLPRELDARVLAAPTLQMR